MNRRPGGGRLEWEGEEEEKTATTVDLDSLVCLYVLLVPQQ